MAARNQRGKITASATSPIAEAKAEAERVNDAPIESVADRPGNSVATDDSARSLDSVRSVKSRKRAPVSEELRSAGSVRMTEPAKTAPMKGKGKARGKTISTKEEADWLKSQFPRKLSGASGSWAVTNSGAGFTVDFRIDKRQNNGEPINFGFPRISREMFLTLKGMKANECKRTIEDYVRCHLGDAVRRGDDRARLIAGRLSFAS